MIKVEAIVREEVFEDVKEALNAIDVNGITVSQVMGCGAQRGYKKRVRGTEDCGIVRGMGESDH